MPFWIKAKTRDEEWKVQIPLPGPTLLDHLQHNQVPIKSSCMGKGICHQCRVKVEKGLAPANGLDRKAFSDETLKQGWRLSCGLRPRTNIEVFFPQAFYFQEDLTFNRLPRGEWWVACDLGTTGVEVAGVDSEGVWASIKALNKQVQMGADVMTRLEYAQNNGVEPLQKKATSQLKRLINLLKNNAGELKDKYLNKVYVSGNSAVASFVAGLDVENLAVSPYQPESFQAQKFMVDESEVETLPLIHSFVGGDLFAGLYLLWKQGEIDPERSWILVDVGTNSEILFWNGQKLYISSTPAGPAFEGSSISIGMRAESGAITDPVFEDGQWRFKVIGDDFPKGICGSALVSFVAETVKNELVSPDGEVLKEDLLKLTPELEINQSDIREFQLAKSAIRTGLDLVAKESSVRPQKLFLAGAFGEHLPLSDCHFLGLLPEMPTTTLGNASLEGTLAWGRASETERVEFMSWLESVKEPIELALRDEFQEAFVANMNLGREI